VFIEALSDQSKFLKNLEMVSTKVHDKEEFPREVSAKTLLSKVKLQEYRPETVATYLGYLFESPCRITDIELMYNCLEGPHL